MPEEEGVATGDAWNDAFDQSLDDATTEEIEEGDEATEEGEVLETFEESQMEDSQDDDEPAPPARGPRSGKRPGADEVLSYLEKNYPEAKDVVRSWQQTVSRNVNEFNQLKAQMLDLTSELKAMKEQPAAEVRVEESSKPYNKAQYDLVQSILRDAGVITQDKLQAQEEEKETRSYVDGSLEEGLKAFGDSFGYKDDSGKIMLTEEIKQAIKPILERVEKRGLTPYDLALLSGKVSGRKPANDSRKNLERANVVQRSSGAPRRSTGAVPRKSTDSAEDIFDRAFALARQELTQ